MYEKRVWIRVFQCNINQIKTKEKPIPKPKNTAEMGILECYMLRLSVWYIASYHMALERLRPAQIAAVEQNLEEDTTRKAAF